MNRIAPLKSIIVTLLIFSLLGIWQIGNTYAAGHLPSIVTGSMDWYALGAGVNDRVNTLAYDDQLDSLYLGGEFTEAGYSYTGHMVVWENDTWYQVLGPAITNALGLDGSEVYGAFTGNLFEHLTNYIGYTGFECVGECAPGNGEIKAMAIDEITHTIYVGGLFTTLVTTSASHVGHITWGVGGWEADGAGVNGNVLAMVFDSNHDRLYVGGDFTIAGEVSASHIAVWDGSTWSALGSGLDGSVQALAYDKNHDRLYAGGVFTTAGGSGASNIAMWDGSTWALLDLGINGPVNTLLYDNTLNVLYAGGEFTTAGSVSANNIARWNGIAWSALGTGLNGPAYALTQNIQDNILYVGGEFTTAGGKSANRVAQWSPPPPAPTPGPTPMPTPTNVHWFNLGAGTDRPVQSIEYDQNRRLLYVGKSDRDEYTQGAFIYKWNNYRWTLLGKSSFTSTASGYINSLYYEPQGHVLYSGGVFNWWEGCSAQNITRYGIAGWNCSSLGMDGEVNAISAGPGSWLYISGSFTRQVGGNTLNHIGRLYEGSWSYPIMSGLNDAVLALAYDAGHSILYIAGDFTMVCDTDACDTGIAANKVAKWESGLLRQIGDGLGSSKVRALAYDETHNVLYAAGDGIWKWDGISWTELARPVYQDGNTGIYSLAYDEAHQILYAGGEFASVHDFWNDNYIDANNIIAWDGEYWYGLGSGVDDRVVSLKYDPSDNNLYVGGRFATVNSQTMNHIAAWGSPVYRTFIPITIR